MKDTRYRIFPITPQTYHFNLLSVECQMKKSLLELLNQKVPFKYNKIYVCAAIYTETFLVRKYIEKYYDW